MSAKPTFGTEPDSGPIEVTLVTSQNCHLCDRAHQILAAAQDEAIIDLREIALDSEEGRALQSRWRPPFPPMLLVEGELFGYGRISEGKWRRYLARRINGHRS